MANGYNLPARTLASQQDSAMTQRPDVPRSKFVGSFTRKTTFNAGLLIPFLVDEVLPGDHLKYDVTAYVRMATPIFPLMDNQRIDTHFFFVPNRLVWANWKKFMGEQADPSSPIAYSIPQVVANGDNSGVGSVWDYFGLVTQSDNPYLVGYSSVNGLPFRAYNLIYNEWFRDENLINSAPFSVGDASQTTSDYPVRRRAKSQDYFTSALPWPQKFQAPTIPILGNAPITGIGIDPGSVAVAGTNFGFYETGNGAVNYPEYLSFTNINTLFANVEPYGTSYRPKIYADMAAVTGVGINQLRQAFLTQQLLERDARGGTRYTEIVRSHFGVISPDARMQRPEYIGGGSSMLNITPVAQTAPSDDGVVGTLGAAGTAVGQHRASYASTEHGYVIGIVSVRSELSYGQGIPRTFSRQTRYDFYWPSLAGLGEQEILRKELFAVGNANDNVVFGYQERWHEYRTRTSEITGRFRTYVSGTLAPWHLGQNFSSAPTLGKTFIEDSPPMDRVLAADEEAANQVVEYLGDFLIKREAVRPLPMFGTPVTLGRF